MGYRREEEEDGEDDLEDEELDGGEAGRFSALRLGWVWAIPVVVGTLPDPPTAWGFCFHRPRMPLSAALTRLEEDIVAAAAAEVDVSVGETGESLCCGCLTALFSPADEGG